MNKFNVGQLVNDRINPAQKFLITRYFDGLYYVKNINYMHSKKELVFMESQIAESPVSHEDTKNNSTGIFGQYIQSISKLLRF